MTQSFVSLALHYHDLQTSRKWHLPRSCKAVCTVLSLTGFVENVFVKVQFLSEHIRIHIGLSHSDLVNSHTTFVQWIPKHPNWLWCHNLHGEWKAHQFSNGSFIFVNVLDNYPSLLKVPRGLRTLDVACRSVPGSFQMGHWKFGWWLHALLTALSVPLCLQGTASSTPGDPRDSWPRPAETVWAKSCPPSLHRPLEGTWGWAAASQTWGWLFLHPARAWCLLWWVQPPSLCFTGAEQLKWKASEKNLLLGVSQFGSAPAHAPPCCVWRWEFHSIPWWYLCGVARGVISVFTGRIAAYTSVCVCVWCLRTCICSPSGTHLQCKLQLWFTAISSNHREACSCYILRWSHTAVCGGCQEAPQHSWLARPNLRGPGASTATQLCILKLKALF